MDNLTSIPAVSDEEFSIFCRDAAKKHLSEAFAYAVQDCNMPLEEFYRAFISTGMARSFEVQEPKYVLGHSGREIVHLVRQRMTDKWEIYPRFSESVPFYTPEYWLGWTLAGYQWESKRTFADIIKYTNIPIMLQMYIPYHEMASKLFYEKIESMRGDR